MCRRIPGHSTFLVNVEKLGVAWGRGYMDLGIHLLQISSEQVYKTDWVLNSWVRSLRWFDTSNWDSKTLPVEIHL